MSESLVNGKPNARIAFAEGDYGHALRCYMSISEWVRSSGAMFVDGMEGVIHHPAHPLNPPLARVVPSELIDQEGWSVTVNFYCEAGALAWLLEQTLPAGARLEFPDGRES